MYTISDQQLDLILSDLSRNGIKTESLQYDLLDHICILIEQNLEEGADFEVFYASVIKTFYKQHLREIEEETNFMLACKDRWVLGRNQFFLLLFGVFVGPFIAYDVLFLTTFGPMSKSDKLIWEATSVFTLYLLLILLVLYLIPERLDPVIPRRSKILVGMRPLIKIVPFSKIAEV
jgi:hypothetical protein